MGYTRPLGIGIVQRWHTKGFEEIGRFYVENGDN